MNIPFLPVHGYLVLSLVCTLLGAIPAGAVLNVTKFGAAPNTGKDETSAFIAAFAALKDAQDKHIVIPKGRYNLRADGNTEHPGVLFLLNGMDNLTIEGRGAELMMSGAAGVFEINKCSNVNVSGITIDWQRPPFSEGTVIASTPRSFDVKVLDAYPVKGGEAVGAFMSYHANTRLPDGRDLDVYGAVERTELISPQVLRVYLNREIPVPVGRLLVLRHEVYGHNGFTFNRCTNVKAHDITIYTCPGMALIGLVCTDVSLKRVNVLNRPGTNRLMSATADATHFGGCKGTVTYEDCIFEGMGDDGANVKSGLYLTVCKIIDDHTVLGQHNLTMVDLPDAGDTLEMSRTDSLSAYATGKVRTAKLEQGAGNMHRVEFDQAMPPALHVGDVLGNASRAPKLRMRNCTVRGNRARGVLCQTRDAVIENCTFSNCTGAGVLVLTEVVYFFESIGTRDVTVRNCRFVNCNNGAASAEAALCALAYLKDYSYPKTPGVHRNVVFEGNHFQSTAESAIFAVAVDGLTVKNNTAEQVCMTAGRPTGKYAICVMDCARVRVDGNKVDVARQGKGMIAPKLVTGTVAP